MTPALPARMVIAAAVAAILQPVPSVSVCRRCGWKPPEGPAVTVSTVAELERAVASVHPGDTILLANGSYALRQMIDIRTPDVTLRSKSGDRTQVVLHGRGMTGDSVGVAISVSAP